MGTLGLISPLREGADFFGFLGGGNRTAQCNKEHAC